MTKFGKFLCYKVVAPACIFIGRHPVLYWILNLTWGLPMTLVGALISLFLAPFSEFVKIGNSYYIILKKDLDFGLELGHTFLVGNVSEDTNIIQLVIHEYGHTCQNALFGPFYILIWIASAVRYWYIEMKLAHNKKLNTDYDDIWFEGSATMTGFYTLIFDRDDKIKEVDTND